ncbi:MAG TPA: SRPBCC family protein [Casimicrobiaceae bacterium]|nr:SRPBCC family protein [Casimicrobiaceae bacterium]
MPVQVRPRRRPVAEAIAEGRDIDGIEIGDQFPSSVAVIFGIGPTLGLERLVQGPRFDRQPPADPVEVALESFEPAHEIHRNRAIDRQAIELRTKRLFQPRCARGEGNSFAQASQIFVEAEVEQTLMIAAPVIARDEPVPGVADERELEVIAESAREAPAVEVGEHMLVRDIDLGGPRLEEHLDARAARLVDMDEDEAMTVGDHPRRLPVTGPSIYRLEAGGRSAAARLRSPERSSRPARVTRGMRSRLLAAAVHSPHPAFLLIAALLAATASGGFAAMPSEEIAVAVEQQGEEIVVHVDCPVRAPHALVWEVLTDYDHMPRFVTNLHVSEVRARDGDTLQVFQRGSASRGPLSFSFENLREIRLVPQQEIRSRLISGTLKSSEFTTRVVDDGASVHILNSGRFVPDVWVPPVIGPAVIQAETRKQFEEIRAEILRRMAQAAQR